VLSVDHPECSQQTTFIKTLVGGTVKASQGGLLLCKDMKEMTLGLKIPALSTTKTMLRGPEWGTASGSFPQGQPIAAEQANVTVH